MKHSPIFKFLCLVALIAVSAYVAWSWFFQTGLYAILIRLQIEHLEGLYYPAYTGIGLWFVLAVPFFSMGLSSKPKHQEFKPATKGTFAWCLVWAAIFGAGGAATYSLSMDAPGEDQPTLVIEDLNQLGDQSLWFKKVSLRGIAATEITVTIEDQGTDSVEYYVPIIASDGDSNQVKFIATGINKNIERMDPNLLLEGFVRPAVLPIIVRDFFEEGGAVVDDQVYLIGKSIPSLQNIYWIVTFILGFLALMSMIMIPILVIQNKRNQ